ncbi:transcription factor 7-like 1-D [Corythoichthys intestinalis]|uniref:transcription factor 7-like 1-D n=1 Tax=Corythoichthys intestinalis TaxID=161448 RepID=UPI0025A53D77|nr:transcription factor 7-like 1-D [Corythoichthys intestinalis]
MDRHIQQVKRNKCCNLGSTGCKEEVQVSGAEMMTNKMKTGTCRKRTPPVSDYIKKPPNAFMLYMKEQRPLVKAQFVNMDSASVNRILGQMWKSLTTTEQEKYFAESERLSAIHAATYPGWSCRNNYGKRKKRQWGKEATLQNNPIESLITTNFYTPEIPVQAHLPSTSTCDIRCLFGDISSYANC